MLAKNQINRNKVDNKAKSDNKNLDFMPFIQNNINGHIEWERMFQDMVSFVILRQAVKPEQHIYMSILNYQVR